MRSATLWFVAAMTASSAAGAQVTAEPTPPVHVTYEAYTAGLHVAEIDAALDLGPTSYQVSLAYHITGFTSVFFHGYQYDVADGGWAGVVPRPRRFRGEGRWRGEQRLVRMEYADGMPVIRELKPAPDEEREVVPDALQKNAVDSVSALAQLVRTVARTGRCDGSVRTYDGRRAIEVQSTTAGEEVLPPTGRSTFAGKALRCDFVGRMLAGFKVDDDREKAGKPLRGSAWLAPTGVGTTALPVRMTFQTRGFGDATLYLTAVGEGATIDLAKHQQ
jgi:Protein of unknown function (DUF3108)